MIDAPAAAPVASLSRPIPATRPPTPYGGRSWPPTGTTCRRRVHRHARRHHAALTPAELATVRCIDYGYWTDFSCGTRLAAGGARRLGPWQHLPPGTIYRQIDGNLRHGRLALPLILLGETGPANLVALEGHKRLTGLLPCPQWLPAELGVLLGIAASHHK